MATVLSGVVFAAFGAVVLWLSAGFPAAPSVAADPALLPRSVGILLIATGAGIVGTSRLQPARLQASRAKLPLAVAAGPASPGGAVDVGDAEGSATPGTLVLLIAGTAAYAWLAMNAGYITMTVLFVVAVTLALGRWPSRTKVLGVIVFALVFSITVEYVFASLLHVPLPDSFLP